MVRFRDIIRIEQKNRHRLPSSKDDIQAERPLMSDLQIMDKAGTQDTFDLNPAHTEIEDVEANFRELFEKEPNLKDKEFFSPVDRKEIANEVAISEAKELDEAYNQAAEIFEEKKSVSLKQLFLLITLVFILLGVLWQNGVLPIDRYLFGKQAAFTQRESALSEKRPAQPVEENKQDPDSVRARASPPYRASNAASELSPATTVRHPYTLHMGSFKSLNRAEKSFALLKEKGLHPYWMPVDLGKKGKWFRVFVGYFTTPDEADKFQKARGITADRILKTAYAVKIGEYSSKEELDHGIRTLKKSDYSPYVIEDPQKGFRLLIGAYQTPWAAANLARKLKETGLDCEVVLR